MNLNNLKEMSTDDLSIVIFAATEEIKSRNKSEEIKVGDRVKTTDSMSGKKGIVVKIYEPNLELGQYFCQVSWDDKTKPWNAFRHEIELARSKPSFPICR